MLRLLVSRMILGFLLVTLTQLLLTGWELTRLQAVHNGVLASADHARNSAAAQEMEINLIEVGLATQAFLLTHEPRMIDPAPVSRSPR